MSSVDVFFGSIDRNAPVSDPFKVVDSADIIMHPDYDNQQIVNDIGLIKLPDDVPLSDTVGVVALTKGDDSLVDSAVTVSGFGKYASLNDEVNQVRF